MGSPLNTRCRKCMHIYRGKLYQDKHAVVTPSNFWSLYVSRYKKEWCSQSCWWCRKWSAKFVNAPFALCIQGGILSLPILSPELSFSLSLPELERSEFPLSPYFAWSCLPFLDYWCSDPSMILCLPALLSIPPKSLVHTFHYSYYFHYSNLVGITAEQRAWRSWFYSAFHLLLLLRMFSLVVGSVDGFHSLHRSVWLVPNQQ